MATKPRLRKRNPWLTSKTPKQKKDTEKVTDIDEVPFHKLNLGQDKQKEGEPLEVTESLVAPPLDSTNMESTTKEEEEGLTEVEVRLRVTNGKVYSCDLLLLLILVFD